MAVTAQQIVAKFAPAAKPDYLTAFQDQAGLIAAAGITTPLRLAHFMAQVLHESGALTVQVESGRYSATNLGDMWDAGNWHGYFANRAACVAMAAQCKVDGGRMLFSTVYGGRMGNAKLPSNDGWTYRGRGILQTTGRESYTKFGARCGVPFATQPDLIFAAPHALKPALAEWTDKNCNDAADRNDIVAVTRLINGGTVGLPQRRAWFAKIWPFVVGPAPATGTPAWRVQVALAGLGYDTGNPDGDIGPRSRAAILAFRATRALPATPTIGSDLPAALGLS